MCVFQIEFEFRAIDGSDIPAKPPYTKERDGYSKTEKSRNYLILKNKNMKKKYLFAFLSMILLS
ncbi:MAG: hypothetical protein LBK94_07045, partial [Prevotellaceae bacterium]|nr:hypothetical protein [Prevotellaceae bacterium]